MLPNTNKNRPLTSFCFFRFLLSISPLFTGVVHSQRVDSLKKMESFLQLCYAYKKPVMHVGINYTVATNLVNTPEDTLTQEAEFYILPQQGYMRFGEIEQVVSDTMALVISKKLKRVLLFNNPAPIIAQMKANTGIDIPKASITDMAKLYSVRAESIRGDTATLVLETRSRVYGGNFPKESIAIRYNVNTNRPYAVLNTKRQTIPVERNEYLKMKLQPSLRDVAFENTEGSFVVKEQTVSYLFTLIEYEGVRIPIGINDRITKNATGVYVPVGPCKSYTLTEE